MCLTDCLCSYLITPQCSHTHTHTTSCPAASHSPCAHPFVPSVLLGERGRFADETRSKSSTRQAGRNDGVTHFLTQKLKSIKSTRTSIRIIGIRNWQQLRDYRCSTMEKTNRWRMDVHSFVDKTSHLTTVVLRRGDDVTVLRQVLGECWDDTHKSRSVVKFVYRQTLTRLFLPVC